MCLPEGGEVSLTCAGGNLAPGAVVARCWAAQAAQPDRASSWLPHKKPAALQPVLCGGVPCIFKTRAYLLR